MVTKTHKGWAVQVQFPGETEPFLCGVWFWAWKHGNTGIPPYLDGCRTAFFLTRAKAREAARKLRRKDTRVSVVRASLQVCAG